MRGKTMPERVAPYPFDDSRSHDGFADRLLEQCFMDMVAALLAGFGVLPAGFLGENPLPTPFSRRIRVFSP